MNTLNISAISWSTGFLFFYEFLVYIFCTENLKEKKGRLTFFLSTAIKTGIPNLIQLHLGIHLQSITPVNCSSIYSSEFFSLTEFLHFPLLSFIKNCTTEKDTVVHVFC